MSSKENSDERILQKILSYSRKITAIIKKHNSSFSEFESDDEFYGSISMFEMQIGELTSHLTTNFRDETKDIIPWRSIKGMRNLYAHEYDKMEAKDIWSAAINDIPTLVDFCESYLEE